ncbi:MAG: translation elongation factor 4 [Acidobacteriota bacterium]|jgi:GTP-binding protein LepA
MKPDRIRNFSIIAHIDHGKSTLADRMLERTGALSGREMTAQVLDDMDLERERGITIKARTVALRYRSQDGDDYLLNLIDTPGHVDFSYEVSRALLACEGALLIVDATQGVEAQTLANTYLAIEGNLEIIPVINKIDLPSARPDAIREEIEDLIGLDATHAVLTSAKEGVGIDEVLEEIVHMIPPPKGDADAPLQALIFDSWYDSYRGVVVLFRVVEGTIRVGQRVRLMVARRSYEIDDLGIFTPKETRVESLSVGQVGCFTAQIKDVHNVKIGDTITDESSPAAKPLPGFREVKPMVFAGLYPTESSGYEDLRDAMEKLVLNDASFLYEPESSEALGFGFRCGFLGLLHMEIIQARLEREFDLGLITTAPSVVYKVRTSDGEWLDVSNPTKLPSPQFVEEIQEPYITALILTPPDYLGFLLSLTEEKRGIQKELKYLNPQRVMLTYELPLTEVVSDFYDRMKAGTRGYASLDYHLSGYRASDMVKLDLLVNGAPVDALSLIVHRDKAYARGRSLAAKMKEVIPRQMFEVIIQAALGSRVIARESVPALRKNVLAKCYGGDITRKRKLLEKQKEGKRRMKRVGRVDIPQEAFMAVLKL